MDEFFNCGFSVVIPYVQHLCASGTNAWAWRHQSTSCWCAIVSKKSPNREEIWREISWFGQGNLTGKKEILHSKREISLKTYGSTDWTSISAILTLSEFSLHGAIDYRSYQMSHCVSIPWFSCPRFSRVRHLLPKWRLLPKCVNYTYCQNGGQRVFIKNRGHNFGWVIHLVLSIICDGAHCYTG